MLSALRSFARSFNFTSYSTSPKPSAVEDPASCTRSHTHDDPELRQEGGEFAVYAMVGFSTEIEPEHYVLPTIDENLLPLSRLKANVDGTIVGQSQTSTLKACRLVRSHLTTNG